MEREWIVPRELGVGILCAGIISRHDVVTVIIKLSPDREPVMSSHVPRVSKISNRLKKQSIGCPENRPHRRQDRIHKLFQTFKIVTALLVPHKGCAQTVSYLRINLVSRLSSLVSYLKLSISVPVSEARMFMSKRLNLLRTLSLESMIEFTPIPLGILSALVDEQTNAANHDRAGGCEVESVAGDVVGCVFREEGPCLVGVQGQMKGEEGKSVWLRSRQSPVLGSTVWHTHRSQPAQVACHHDGADGTCARRVASRVDACPSWQKSALRERAGHLLRWATYSVHRCGQSALFS